MAEYRSFWRSAERLHISESTLSKHIRTLEKSLGVPLFHRTTRSVELTEYGRILLPYAQSIMQLQSEYRSILRIKRESLDNSFVIGCLPSMGQYEFINLLTSYHREHPEVAIKVMEEYSTKILELLRDRKCDLVFCRDVSAIYTGISDEKICRLVYRRDFLVAVVGKNHHLAGSGPLQISEMRKERFCFVSEGSCLRSLCSSSCQEAGFDPLVVFESGRVENILDVVADGTHAALLMNEQVQFAMRSYPKDILSVRPVIPEVSSNISLCYLREVPLTRAAADFVRYISFQISVSGHKNDCSMAIDKNKRFI